MTVAPFVLVAGNIGAGKSTVVEIVATELGMTPYVEEVGRNPYFADFYAHPARWAFRSQLAFISAAIADQVEIGQRHEPAILDRGPHEMLEVFAAHHRRIGNISPRDFDILDALLDGVDPVLRTPDLLVYVQAPVGDLIRRIEVRGRAEEQGVSMDYLNELQELYESFLARRETWPTLRIDTAALDPRTDTGRSHLVKAVAKAIEV